jgi:RimJ/RimL family protein N-acetyltransferase
MTLDNHCLTKDGRKFLIRQPVEDDAEAIINYSKILFESTDQVLTTPEEYTITVDNEKVWINNFKRNPDALVLIADIQGEVAGLLFFVPNPKKKNSHTGEFGVSVHPDFQNIGIGRLLVKTLLNWANENSRVEKVYLNVFETNKNAIKLYRDLGFIEEGRHVKAVKQLTGEYVDVLQMFIETTSS